MDIRDVRYTEIGSICATIDGAQMFIPDNASNAHRRVIAEWEAAGNTISPYVPVRAEGPPAPLPRLAFWLAAVEIGVTKAGVKARIDAMPEGVEKAIALVYLEEAQQYRRSDPLLNAMAEAEHITQVQLDTLWTWALDRYV